MTGPRIPLLRRKDAPETSNEPEAKAPGSAGGSDPQEEAGEIATCPQCGCTFDPASGEVVPVGDMGGAMPNVPMPEMGGQP